jgi:hypothetical protein
MNRDCQMTRKSGLTNPFFTKRVRFDSYHKDSTQFDSILKGSYTNPASLAILVSATKGNANSL